MAIALEFINVVVPISVVVRKYPGGWERCLEDHADVLGSVVWYDDHLFRDGAMSPADIETTVDRWRSLGFTPIATTGTGRPCWKDVCVVEALSARPTLPCGWISIDADRHVAYLKGTAPGRIAGPADRC